MDARERELREAVEAMLLADISRRAWELAEWPDADKTPAAVTS